MKKPIIGITIGDINGIGPEVIIKLFSSEKIYQYCTPVIYGSTRVLSYYKKVIENKRFQYAKFKTWDDLYKKQATIISTIKQEPIINMGEETEVAARYALDSINTALQDWKDGHIDAIITAPINKNTVAKIADKKFTGHTEYITDFCGDKKSMMLLASDALRVGLVTNHIPLQNVSDKLTTESILNKIEILDQSLKQDFMINGPKIAVLGLNPHAGDRGLLGKEEIDVIEPAIAQAKRKGIYAFGTYSADGFFGSSDFKAFDGVVAMYHDQGLIPFKSLCFDEGVNFTAGIDLIRTSPDHGTAYRIAGKNKADATSIRQALFLAIDVVNKRKEYLETIANKLIPTEKKRK
ncbi:MAG: 4-hydroxythreonine-4-phosphate dehydrogenase PdxA [Chitinophagales bacterium]